MNYTDALIEEPVIVAIVGSATDETIYYIGYDYNRAKLTYENFKEPFKTTIGSVDGSCLALLEYVGDLVKFDKAAKKLWNNKNDWFVLSDFFDKDDYEIIESYDGYDEDIEESLNEAFSAEEKMEMWVKGTLHGQPGNPRKENIGACSDTKLINYAGILYRMGRAKSDSDYFKKLLDIANELGKRGNTSGKANVEHLYQMAMGGYNAGGQTNNTPTEPTVKFKDVELPCSKAYQELADKAIGELTHRFQQSSLVSNNLKGISSRTVSEFNNYCVENIVKPILEKKSNGSWRISNIHLIDTITLDEAATALAVNYIAMLVIESISETLINVIEKLTKYRYNSFDDNVSVFPRTDSIEININLEYLAKDLGIKFQILRPSFRECIDAGYNWKDLMYGIVTSAIYGNGDWRGELSNLYDEPETLMQQSLNTVRTYLKQNYDINL